MHTVNIRPTAVDQREAEIKVTTHAIITCSCCVLLQMVLKFHKSTTNAVSEWCTVCWLGSSSQLCLYCRLQQPCIQQALTSHNSRLKASPYSITDSRVPELIPVLGSQPAGDVSHKHGGRLPLLSARHAVTPATLKRAATNFAAWWKEARWVLTVCLRQLPDSVAAAIWTQALLPLSPAR